MIYAVIARHCYFDSFSTELTFLLCHDFEVENNNRVYDFDN